MLAKGMVVGAQFEKRCSRTAWRCWLRMQGAMAARLRASALGGDLLAVDAQQPGVSGAAEDAMVEHQVVRQFEPGNGEAADYGDPG